MNEYGKIKDYPILRRKICSIQIEIGTKIAQQTFCGGCQHPRFCAFSINFVQISNFYFFFLYVLIEVQ